MSNLKMYLLSSLILETFTNLFLGRSYKVASMPSTQRSLLLHVYLSAYLTAYNTVLYGGMFGVD